MGGPRSLSRRGLFPLGVSVRGALCHEDPPPNTVTGGRYVSYWNAFLYYNSITYIKLLGIGCILFYSVRCDLHKVVKFDIYTASTVSVEL